MKAIAFTGHRPNRLKGYNPKDNKELLWKIHYKCVEYIVNEGVDTFIQGLSIGIDIWSALIVLKLKEDYPHIKLISCAPCLNHKDKWPKESQDTWDYVVSKSDEFIIVTEEPYSAKLMQIRNQYMVDRAFKVLAVWDGTNGGTDNCVNYARKKNKIVDIIKP